MLAGVGGAAAGTAAAAATPHVVKVAANPKNMIAFVQKKLTAPHGKITFAFTNAASLGHNFAVEKKGSKKVLGKTATISGGKTVRLTLTLKKGAYTFLCTVPGHAAAGMKGTLTVT